MDNKQLLERAAKAAGYTFEWHGGSVWINGQYEAVTDTRPWNPIESDADAFRLMVDCGMKVQVFDDYASFAEATAYNEKTLTIHCWPENYADHDNDKHAAARMAIVRAASQSQESA